MKMEDVQALVVGPHDKLVLVLPVGATNETATEIKRSIEGFLDPGRVLVVGGMTVAVVQSDEVVS
jgi:hypothetical protein